MQFNLVPTEHEMIERIVEIKPEVRRDDEDEPEDTTDEHGNNVCGTYAIDSAGRVWKLQTAMTGVFHALRLDRMPKADGGPKKK